MRRLIACLFCVAVVALLYLGATTSGQNKGPVKLHRIDLTGTWTNDKGEEIIINQTPFLVTGKLAKGGGDCDLPGPNRKRPLYLNSVIQGRGVYEGSTFKGEMGGCTRVPALVQDCHFEVAYIVKFTADKVSVNSISGEYIPDYVNYDEKDGHFTNCVLRPGAGMPQRFSLTRKCDSDKGSLCETLGRMAKEMKDARTQTASTQFYQHLQMQIGDELASVRTNLCDIKEAEAKLDEVESNLDSLSYVSGPGNLQNNVTMGYIENGLRDLIRMSCAVGPPVDYGSCPDGTVGMSGADKKLLDTFQPTLVNMLRTSAFDLVAYDKTKQCVGKMFGSHCALQPFTQALAAVALAHQEMQPVTDKCEIACKAFGAWYVSQACSKEGLRKDTVIAKCKLACMAPEWGQ